MTRTVVIAIGGNSLIADDAHQSVADQYQAAADTCVHIASMLEAEDLRLVVTHGNGPQVGFILPERMSARTVLNRPTGIPVASTRNHLRSI